MILSHNLIPDKTPVMSIPPALKLAALAVTAVGLLAALEVLSYTTKMHAPAPRSLYNFPTLLGFFPLIMHRLVPRISLTLGQLVASQMLDQTSAEKVGPKAITGLVIPMAGLASDTQRSLIKAYIMLFSLTVAIATHFIIFTHRLAPHSSHVV